MTKYIGSCNQKTNPYLPFKSSITVRCHIFYLIWILPNLNGEIKFFIYSNKIIHSYWKLHTLHISTWQMWFKRCSPSVTMVCLTGDECDSKCVHLVWQWCVWFGQMWIKRCSPSVTVVCLIWTNVNLKVFTQCDSGAFDWRRMWFKRCLFTYYNSGVITGDECDSKGVCSPSVTVVCLNWTNVNQKVFTQCDSGVFELDKCESKGVHPVWQWCVWFGQLWFKRCSPSVTVVCLIWTIMI